TYPQGRFGGFEGRALEKGDVLRLYEPDGEPIEHEIPDDWKPSFETSTTLRVVTGLYDYRLTNESKRLFLEADWTLTPVADRIGFRYAGPKLEWLDRPQPFGAGSDPSNVTDSVYP